MREGVVGDGVAIGQHALGQRRMRLPRCGPSMKNVAARIRAFSASSTRSVVPGKGPSSKVSTTSLARAAASAGIACVRPAVCRRIDRQHALGAERRWIARTDGRRGGAIATRQRKIGIDVPHSSTDERANSGVGQAWRTGPRIASREGPGVQARQIPFIAHRDGEAGMVDRQET